EAVRLSPRERRHIEKVLRLGSGDAIEIFDGSGAGARATLVAHPDGGLAARVNDVFPRIATSLSRVTAVCALIKGDRQFEVVEKLVEIGICEIFLFRADRSIRRPGPELAKRIADHAAAAAKQCGRADLPRVEVASDLDAALGCLENPRGFVFERSESVRFSASDVDQTVNLAFVVGPEGGLTDSEIRTAIGRGFEPRSLPLPVLRADTAAVACASLLIFAAADRDRPGEPVEKKTEEAKILS
ncbi:MAG: 16S rRNA (uracil(1498)-N(3))-methyltransferase, partial [Deltaproteobacteria bacterium]|nr:16S rRNA (uracil(1498)-N(3))-methyltransferase [Deltaproteobacteria bacterium]